jgi:membrane-bound metal-dependent hydrolase YbcI (DUF457 family)
MKKKNHIIFGAIFVISFIFILTLFNLDIFRFTLISILTITAITLFYSLLPDIDHKNSTITWWFFGIGVLGLVIGMLEIVFKINFISPLTVIFLSTLLLVFTYISVNLFNHRGLIHSIPIGILAVLPLYLLLHSFAYCFLAYVAWHSHLVGDGYLIKMK